MKYILFSLISNYSFCLSLSNCLNFINIVHLCDWLDYCFSTFERIRGILLTITRIVWKKLLLFWYISIKNRTFFQTHLLHHFFISAANSINNHRFWHITIIFFILNFIQLIFFVCYIWSSFKILGLSHIFSSFRFHFIVNHFPLNYIKNSGQLSNPLSQFWLLFKS